MSLSSPSHSNRPRNKRKIILTDADIAILTGIISKCENTRHSAIALHARIVLMSGRDQLPDWKIAELLKIGVATVTRWRHAWCDPQWRTLTHEDRLRSISVRRSLRASPEARAKRRRELDAQAEQKVGRVTYPRALVRTDLNTEPRLIAYDPETGRVTPILAEETPKR